MLLFHKVFHNWNKKEALCLWCLHLVYLAYLPRDDAPIATFRVASAYDFRALSAMKPCCPLIDDDDEKRNENQGFVVSMRKKKSSLQENAQDFAPIFSPICSLRASRVKTRPEAAPICHCSKILGEFLS